MDAEWVESWLECHGETGALNCHIVPAVAIDLRPETGVLVTLMQWADTPDVLHVDVFTPSMGGYVGQLDEKAAFLGQF